MITVIHGGQTGVDRGAHEAALDNAWGVAGFMPRDGRDELGPIPPDIARFLRAHEKTIYAARTAANVRACDALLVVVRDADDPRATPGTTTTLDLAADRHVPRMVVDPRFEAPRIARWIWGMLPLELPLVAESRGPLRLMVAGPRESKWPGARVEAAGLLRRVGIELRMLGTQRCAS